MLWSPGNSAYKKRRRGTTITRSILISSIACARSKRWRGLSSRPQDSQCIRPVGSVVGQNVGDRTARAEPEEQTKQPVCEQLERGGQGRVEGAEHELVSLVQRGSKAG